MIPVPQYLYFSVSLQGFDHTFERQPFFIRSLLEGSKVRGALEDLVDLRGCEKAAA
jgi:hypothetical protein